MYDIFVQNIDYRETAQYEKMILGVQTGSLRESRGCLTNEDVDEYFHRLMRSFESMSKNGYLTQAELGGKLHDEIPLYLATDGRFVKLGGANHRILMAEILGVEWVPVILRGADPRWLVSLCCDLGLAPHQVVDEWFDRTGVVRRDWPHGENLARRRV